MFFKTINTKKEGHVLIGQISIQRDAKERSYKALRCMSVLMSDIMDIIDCAIIEKRGIIVAKDIMGLELKPKPTRRSSLPILELGDRGAGWVPSINVLHAMGHEFEQFLAYMNTMLISTKNDYLTNKDKLISQINEQANILNF